MSEDLAKAPATDPIMERLEDQIAWYDRKSLSNQRTYKRFKVTEILAAAVIPFLAAFNVRETTWVAGGLGVVVTVLEGVLHLNQYQQNWITYRSTCEPLKHEQSRPLRKRDRSALAIGRKDRVSSLSGIRQVDLGSTAEAQSQRCPVSGICALAHMERLRRSPRLQNGNGIV